MVHLSDVHRIIAEIGPDAIQSRLGVTVYSLLAAKRERQFPALWYAEISDMCAEQGVDCPRDVFAWKRQSA